MVKYICKIILICIFVCLMLFVSIYNRTKSDLIYSIFPTISSACDNSWVENTFVVGHATGGIEGCNYTNSVESFLHTINSGVNVIEVDFQYTVDKELVCYHTLSDVYVGLCNGVLFEDFMNLKVQGKYTPMSFEDVISIMYDNPEIYVAVDTKYDNLIEMIGDIYNKCKDENILNRLIIQLYYPNQKEQVQEIYDFPNMLFAPYKYSTNPYDTLKVCYQEGINVVVVNYKSWSYDIFKLFKSKNIYVFTYTVNRKDIADKLLSEGVYGIYTDFLLDYKKV